MGKIIRGGAPLLFSGALMFVLAGCGANHAPSPAVTVTVTVSPKSVPASPSPVSSASANMNEQLFAQGISASIPVVATSVVAGPIMLAYVQFEHAYGAAWAAVGQESPSSGVTQIAGGFKMCYSTNCDAFTQFVANRVGQITGVSINGQTVTGRIATAPSSTSGGLTISAVTAYRLTDTENQVAVAFKLTDNSYRPVNTSPALLASLSGASDTSGQDALPATLAPGDTLYAAAVFDVTQPTGLFCLQPNDGFGEHLPCTSLRLA